MRKIVLAISIFICVACVGLFWALQTPTCWQFLLKKFLTKGSHHVLDVKIKDVSWQGMGFEFKEVTIKAKHEKATFFYSIGSLQASLRSVHAQHTAIVSNAINVSNLNVDANLVFNGLQFKSTDGKFNAERMEFNKYVITDVLSPFNFEADQLHLNGFKGKFYDGTVAGDILIATGKHFTYSVDLGFVGVNVNQMASINPGIFDNMKGKIEGKAKLSGASNGLNSVEANIHTIEGGEIKAELLRYLAQYIPQRQQIEALIQSNSNVPLDQADVVIKNIGQKQMSSQFTMKSSKLNLDVNVAVDINIEGGLSSLLKYLNQF